MKYTLTLLTILFISSHAFCCSCKPAPSIENSYNSEYTHSIVSGVVLSKEEAVFEITVHYKSTNTESKRNIGEMKYTFLIEEIIKGSFVQDTISIITGKGVSDCGYEFEVGKKYIVYGHDGIRDRYTFTERGLSIYTTYCGRTKEYNEQEIQNLRELKDTPDFSISGLALCDSASINTFLQPYSSQLDSTKSSVVICTTSDSSYVLKAYYAPDSTQNMFYKFEVYRNTHDELGITTNIKRFVTNNDIKINISKNNIIDILGKYDSYQYKYGKEIFIYTSKNFEHSSLINTTGKPYVAKYMFFGDKLIGFEFGFELTK
jgi:hypothetical protein